MKGIVERDTTKWLPSVQSCLNMDASPVRRVFIDFSIAHAAPPRALSASKARVAVALFAHASSFMFQFYGRHWPSLMTPSRPL